MECPRCHLRRQLVDVTLRAEGVEAPVRQCPKCLGQLFERAAFTPISETPLPYEPDLARIPEPGAQLKPLACPACGDKPMMKVQSRREVSVTMDVCGACNAIWLDSGELDAIRGREHTFARAAWAWIKDRI